ncbi:MULTISPECIES: hypothetical protein [Brevibacterium]|uniref:hypothetical protein n=1 Tax=Brevibacterium TaxID=1696 RepID=UPI001EF491F2|nr:hypothetical protein [Brevibacterium sp. ACRRH]MCG7298739.1 hypothetical protein [Brevibacterium sp. ACRRH]
MNTSRHQPGVNARPGRTGRLMAYPAYAQSGPESPIPVLIPISSPGSDAVYWIGLTASTSARYSMS